MDPSGSSLTGQILLIIVLTVLNGIFAATELAYVSVNQRKMRELAEEGDKRAIRVLELLENSDDFLATIQVIITFVGFFSSASASTTFAARIAARFPNVPYIEPISVFLVTVIISYLSLVFGELFPKQIALQMPDKIALAMSGLVSGVQKIFKPFVKLLSFSTDVLKKITPIDFSVVEEKITRTEMKAILASVQEDGAIDTDEFHMLKGVLSLDNKLAREVMTPRTDAVMIDIEDSTEENLEILFNTRYSRIPVYVDDKDDVVGFILIKNLMRHIAKHGHDNIDLNSLVQDIMIVPSTIYVDDLLMQFREEQQHIAILRDEYGGMEGIVTLEDLIEEIVGEIEDEWDVKTQDEIEKISDDEYTITGGLIIDKFNEELGTNIYSEDVDTIAGVIIQEIGYVPEDNEEIKLRVDDWVMKTVEIESGRIRVIDVLRDPEQTIETAYDLSDKDEGEVDEEANANGRKSNNEKADEELLSIAD